ncbi:hypothetical protein A3K73_00695 [Candidatus Pacearchaeota archaeon RBG_13_36_9]|nr:MAG: hypothetical protein A3K73_00695 [Candidatus Pacearchaeota archaeon RBG_13_36_9]
MKNKVLEKASHETFYDSIKWVIFGIFAIVYFGIKDKYPLSAILFLFLFVVILFLINILRERGFIKIEKMFKV